MAGEEEEPTPQPEAGDATTVNAATPEGVQRQRRARKRRDDADTDTLNGILSTERGRAFLYNILALAGVFEKRIGVSPSGAYDPILSAHHDGQRALGVHLQIEWMKLAPAGVYQMLLENHPEIVAAAKAARGKTSPQA